MRDDVTRNERQTGAHTHSHTLQRGSSGERGQLYCMDLFTNSEVAGKDNSASEAFYNNAGSPA